MFLKHKEPFPGQANPEEAVRYRVLQSEPDLRMAIEGETRMTPTGELVVWDLVLLSPDRYCWHRTDWPHGGCTKAIVRCPSNSSK